MRHEIPIFNDMWVRPTGHRVLVGVEEGWSTVLDDHAYLLRPDGGRREVLWPVIDGRSCSTVEFDAASKSSDPSPTCGTCRLGRLQAAVRSQRSEIETQRKAAQAKADAEAARTVRERERERRATAERVAQRARGDLYADLATAAGAGIPLLGMVQVLRSKVTPFMGVDVLGPIPALLRGRPANTASIHSPAFFAEVLRRPLLVFLAGSAVILAVIGRLTARVLCRQVTPRGLVAAGVCATAGIVLGFGVAPMMVRNADRDVRDYLLAATSFYSAVAADPVRAAAATCLWLNWRDPAAELTMLQKWSWRSPTGAAVWRSACTWRRGDPNPLGVREPSGEASLALFDTTADGVTYLGSISEANQSHRDEVMWAPDGSALDVTMLSGTIEGAVTTCHVVVGIGIDTAC